VERLAGDLIELSTRHNFAHYLAMGAVLRGWARSVSGDAVEGVSWIEDGIEDLRAAGSIMTLLSLLALKAEALHLADRTPEALEAIKEAEVLVERTEGRWWCAELYRLRGVFLAAIGAEEREIEASFCAAIGTAKEQKSGFPRKTRRSNLRRVPPPKSERVGRERVTTTCLVTACRRC
jgi:adenylate cyclase